MKLGVPKPIAAGETRVALIPESCTKLKKTNLGYLVQAGAGLAASYRDEDYASAGARIVPAADDVFADADILAMVQPPAESEIAQIRPGTALICLISPLVKHELVNRLAEARITALALDMMPRITRAQSMDVLSSMSSIAGYKAVLLAATHLPRMFPMMMTAAGTITPAKVLILGAGVAGLQAIATARRLGAVVSAFDVRPVVKEQVESLGARFVVVDSPKEDAQDAGGYAKEMSQAYLQKQRETIHQHVRENDVVITTALIPGKPAPRLIGAEMVRDMKPGSVIIDLASEAGGNCELTKHDQVVQDHGVTIFGPPNLPASVPYHSSQMFARNVTTYLLHLIKDGQLKLDTADEITRETLITRDGEVVHARVRQAMGLASLVKPAMSSVS